MERYISPEIEIITFDVPDVMGASDGTTDRVGVPPEQGAETPYVPVPGGGGSSLPYIPL